MSEAPLSFKVAATLAAYRGVTHVTGTANTVKYPASASERPFGVTTDTVLETTQAIPVADDGIRLLEFAGSVTSGSLVAIDNAGKGVAHTDVTAGSWYLGTLVGPNSSANDIAEVLVQPGFKSIP